MTLSPARFLAFVLGALGLGAALAGWTIAPGAFAGAWLAAFSWFIGWPLGSLALLLIHSLTGGRWGDVLRPALIAGVTALFLIVPLALPLLFTAARLYPWLTHAAPAGKGFYLNAPFFAVRAVVYLTLWCGLGALTLRVLRGATAEASLRRLAPPGLALLAFTVTFAAIDTTMALDPQFNSSVYGLLTMAGEGLLGLSIAVLATALLTRPTPGEWSDLGRLLIGLVVFWAYLDFMQFLIVWQSDLTSEIPWYLRRSQGLWGWVAGLIAIGHFLLPFFLLLTAAAQRRRGIVAGTAALLIGVEVLRAWWLVLPSLGGGFGWIDLAAMIGFAGLSLGWLAHRMGQAREVLRDV
ncbi:MAG TPA: hypothetical protein VGV37_01815 [Aliidongia sp.]|uniref:hypothetical protein n=1 Tax=Aliidongia sp. TaxID=1914230 RepID=UPI002DDD6E30|nr:hypothetical protein [Aliidongia sp.]HEV2673247.1 hypothetical protein [Aliidongia sp.]